ncbi:MAG: HAMP domain-containing histidine kinase [Verrucomicrobia bacterium]|nr:HAMP domain-containing histidine kinase [Verrucomicrobiota bacterium]
MRTPIWLRILIAVDLLVIVAALAIGWFSSEIAGRVVEEHLIRQASRKTGEFLEGQNLPFTDTLMGSLNRMHGTHFVTARERDRAVLGTSFPTELREELDGRTDSLGAAGVVSLGDVRYRYDSHLLEIRTEPYGRETEPARLYAFVPQDEFDDARTLAARRIAKATLPVLASASLIAIVLALTVARPISKLAARMQATETGRLDRLANSESTPTPDGARLRGPREVAELACAFDRLMARLAQAQTDLARHERLATLGRVAASVVHELRNPLSGIRMNVRVLQEELGDRDIHSESLDASLREIERMGVYLDELTDLASAPGAAAESLPLRLGALALVRLEALAGSVLAVFSGRCRHAGVKVVTGTDPPVPHVRADAERLRQVLMNLIVNALDAMPSGGTLDVSVGFTGGRVRCTITDTGAGIQASERESLFEPFVTTKSHSAGLGLYVCKRIVEAHGGAIGCHNTERGAAFWFEIPTAVEPDEPGS